MKDKIKELIALKLKKHLPKIIREGTTGSQLMFINDLAEELTHRPVDKGVSDKDIPKIVDKLICPKCRNTMSASNGYNFNPELRDEPHFACACGNRIYFDIEAIQRQSHPTPKPQEECKCLERAEREVGGHVKDYECTCMVSEDVEDLDSVMADKLKQLSKLSKPQERVKEFLLSKIKGCDELGGMGKEKWAFQQVLKEINNDK